MPRLIDEDGATAVEYALMSGLIAVAIAGAVGLIGDALIVVFENLAAELGW